jgi:N-dimethylarginine dimethylaminohydrolase
VEQAFGGQSMFEPIRRVLVKRPDAAFAVEDPQRWNYAGRPDLENAQREHATLVRILQKAGAEVLYLGESSSDLADAIYVFDPVLITDGGAVILSMGKDLRRGEEEHLAQRLTELEIPIRFTLQGDARAEGGDLLWLDEQTLVVGLGFRTNTEGLTQLRAGLASSAIEVLSVDLPYHFGPAACLHLLSMISIVDRDLAVVYPPLMPVRLWQELRRRDFRLLEVPAEELATMGSNVLAMAPRECLMLEGNPGTRRLLESAGCEVHTYVGRDISLRAEGGPTCLTRPLLRRA